MSGGATAPPAPPPPAAYGAPHGYGLVKVRACKDTVKRASAKSDHLPSSDIVYNSDNKSKIRQAFYILCHKFL